MGIGEWLLWVLMLLLALYGCAHLIRRICLWVTKCPRSVRIYRLAVPPTGGALEPLIRCLQAQAAWHEDGCRDTMVLLPSLSAAEETAAQRLLAENPAVQPVTAEMLTELLHTWQQEA